MLPCRSDRYVFAPVLVAGCFFATAGLSQSYEATFDNQPVQRDDVSIGGKVRLGAATIDLSHITKSDGLGRFSDPSTKREEASSTSFSLNLSDTGRISLFPEVLSFSARKSDIYGQPQIFPQLYGGSILAPDLYDQSRSDYTISADWGAPEDKYSFSFSSSVLDDRLYGGESADINDDMLNFTRTLRTGSWLSSFTASVGMGYREEPGNRERTQKFGASASFKSMQDGAPQIDITAKILQDRTSKLTSGGGDVDTTWELWTGSKIFGGAARNDLTIQPSLSIFFSVKGNSPDEEDKDTNPVDFSAGVSGKVHF